MSSSSNRTNDEPSNSSSGSEPDAADPAVSGPRLSKIDQQLVDALVECGFDPTKAIELGTQSAAEAPDPMDLITAERARRVKNLHALFQALEHHTVCYSERALESLAESTLAQMDADSRYAAGSATLASSGVDASPDTLRKEDAWRIHAHRQHPVHPMTPVGDTQANSGRFVWRRPGWQNILAAAASILILVSVIVPMTSNARERSQRTMCRANMHNVALGMTNYAQAYNGSLPVRYTYAPTGEWLISRVNAANLFTLGRTGFARFDDLTCPNNAVSLPASALTKLDNWPTTDATSFSYQDVLTQNRPQWAEGTRHIVVADKNPVIEKLRAGILASIDELSPSHKDGQNALFNDGSVMWLESSWIGDDNIWVPRSVHTTYPHLNGTEAPADASDAMLTH